MNPKTRLVLDGKSASWKAHLGKWRTFAAVGGASLAAGTNADAGIVYSGPLDVSLSGAGGFASKAFSVGTVVKYKEALNAGPGYAGIFGGKTGPFLKFALNASGNAAKKYASGNPIHAAGALNSSAVAQTHNKTAGGKTFIHGSFGPGTVTGFVGFKAPNGDLGWIKISVSDMGTPTYPNEITLLGWAYNNVSGGPINAGQISGGAVPEPSSLALGLLAAGSVGLAALRRARTRAKVAE